MLPSWLIYTFGIILELPLERGEGDIRFDCEFTRKSRLSRGYVARPRARCGGAIAFANCSYHQHYFRTLPRGGGFRSLRSCRRPPIIEITNRIGGVSRAPRSSRSEDPERSEEFKGSVALPCSGVTRCAAVWRRAAWGHRAV